VEMDVHFEVDSAAASPLTDSASISGGGGGNTTAASGNFPNGVAEEETLPFGFQGYEVAARNPDQTEDTQAGGHPFSLTTTAFYNNELSGEGAFGSAVTRSFEEPDKTVGKLPAGVIVDTQAVPQCSLSSFWTGGCAPEQQVGSLALNFGGGTFQAPVYNLQPELGQPGNLGALFQGIPFFFHTAIDTGGDYSIVSSSEAPGLGLAVGAGGAQLGFSLELWGVPADEHPRGLFCGNPEFPCEARTPSGTTAPPRPYLRLSTDCSVSRQTAETYADSWERFGVFTEPFTTTLSPPDGCNELPFKPSWTVHTTTDLADAPSGLDTDLNVPQNESPRGVAASDVKDTSLTLPKGVSLNPAAANGRVGCSEQQFAIHSPGAPNCPNASKVGEVEVESPLQNHPLPGSVYLAKQDENPFGSTFALYVAVDDPISGIIIKTAGKASPDPRTGQLTTIFEENPQLPFEDLKLHLFGGAAGLLRTPAVCGTYTATSAVTPYSAPASPATPSASFDISSSAHGICPQAATEEPPAPVFHAGTVSPQAGAYSPFAFKLVREDGQQEFAGVETNFPPGLLGKLAGIAYCPDSAIAAAEAKTGRQEQTSPSCPATSEVGAVDVGSGAGPDPIYVSGHAYLTGPYKGAPVGLAVITPAVAGPFDLGTAVVRVALHVDPETAQVRAVSDPLPTVLKGVPLDIRSIALKFNRPQFTLNPTSCEQMAFRGNAVSVLGTVSSLFQRFQVGGCETLAFKPHLGLHLTGSMKRTGHPALRAVLMAKPGEANIASVQVALPHSELLDQGHLHNTCGRPQLVSHTCPPGSIYGYARAVSPLLDKPLAGPVYLGTGYGHRLPDLVADLNGQIEILLHGKVDTDSEGGLRNTFELVPDAPVSEFVLQLLGGKKGLLENSTNICAHRGRAAVELEGHNGKVHDSEPLLQLSCHGAHRHRSHHHKGRAG
jgi:hypothetical protein